jgi:hypothetical protein
MAWTSIALTLVTQGSGSVDMGRPLPGAHETEFVAATVWDPTRSRAVLTGAIDDVLAHALPTLTHGARHTLAAGIARNIERDTADTLRRDPYLTYMGLYVYMQPGASRVPDRRLVRRRLLSARARLRGGPRSVAARAGVLVDLHHRLLLAVPPASDLPVPDGASDPRRLTTNDGRMPTAWLAVGHAPPLVPHQPRRSRRKPRRRVIPKRSRNSCRRLRPRRPPISTASSRHATRRRRRRWRPRWCRTS